MKIDRELDQLSYQIIGVCMTVHQEIGPGSPEEYYQKSLELEFDDQGIGFEPQKFVPVLYKGIQVGANYLDFVIEDTIILEIKSTRDLTDVHLFQTLKYLAWTDYAFALLVNFGPVKMKHKRVLPSERVKVAREQRNSRSVTD